MSTKPRDYYPIRALQLRLHRIERDLATCWQECEADGYPAYSTQEGIAYINRIRMLRDAWLETANAMYMRRTRKA